MEILVIIIAVGAILYVGYKKLDKTKEDGSHPLDGPTQAPYKLEPAVTTKIDGIGHESVPVQPTISNILDVNKDGKVDIEDAKEAVIKTKKKVKEVAAKATEKVKQVKKKKT